MTPPPLLVTATYLPPLFDWQGGDLDAAIATMFVNKNATAVKLASAFIEDVLPTWFHNAPKTHLQILFILFDSHYCTH